MRRSLNSGQGPPDSRPQPSPRPVSPGGSRSWTKRRFRKTGKEDRGWSQLTVQALAELLGPRAHTVKLSPANATQPACSEDREASPADPQVVGPGHSSARLQEPHETLKNRTSVRGGGPVCDARGTKSVPSNSPTAAHGKPKISLRKAALSSPSPLITTEGRSESCTHI